MSGNQRFSHGEDAHSLFEKKPFFRRYCMFSNYQVAGSRSAQVPKKSRDEKHCILVAFFPYAFLQMWPGLSRVKSHLGGRWTHEVQELQGFKIPSSINKVPEVQGSSFLVGPLYLRLNTCFEETWPERPLPNGNPDTTFLNATFLNTKFLKAPLSLTPR